MLSNVRTRLAADLACWMTLNRTARTDPLSMVAVVVVLLLGLAATSPCAAQLTACDDLAPIDFGSCAMPLGVGVIEGQCQSISGCESPITLFTSIQQCETTCPTCNDHSGIDFGPCEAILGAGLLQGSCELISGCNSPVPLFTSVAECEAMCKVVTIEDLQWSTIKTLYRND